MSLVDLDALRRTPVTRDPFFFAIVPNFVEPRHAKVIRRDFPAIAYPGLLPPEATGFGPRFGRLIEEPRSAQVARVFSEKFDIDLVWRRTMITARGHCQAKDGRIHTDSAPSW